MTPGARIQTSIELFNRAESARAPTDAVMDRFFRGKRYIGAKDRRSIAERVYGELRRRARLDWWLARVVGRNELSALDRQMVRLRAIADLALTDRMTAEDISCLFNGSRHCPEPLNEIEKSIAGALEGQPLDHPEMPNWVAFEYPGWLDPMFVELWGDDLARQFNALSEPAALDLRVNSLKCERPEAIASLSRESIESEATQLSPLGLRIRQRVRLGGIDTFRNGLVEVQDEGSQLIALLSDAKPGMTVIDYCAGAGGKTLAMAATMNNKGTLVACDISEKRLYRMNDRLTRAGVSNVVTQPLDGRSATPLLEPSVADRVVLDVPCSGTGTWRREPDAKWRLTPPELEQTLEKQRRITRTGQRLVKPGGRLIYATCSVLPCENEDQAKWFLTNHPDFELVPIGQVWAETVGTPCPINGPYLRLSPADNAT
ncbi:MAG: RsmB/NOP family class I SAM-dependent RNA methyltransferase, partial [Rhodospirillales bacterium]|nr:RsmB/NOP family class I SAM-dependent RNA methyltransferase [Rhodospirillales bacterium]